MSTNNPHLKNIDRAVYELPVLLKNLGDVDFTKPVTEDQGFMAAAARDHAHNANEEIMFGIESLGRVLAMMGAQEDIDGHHVGNIGRLVQTLAVQAQHLQDVDSDMQAVLDALDRQQRGDKAARKGSAS